jgi:16S rRNA (guanine(966)-N(2))-methyltransferase RsmD
LRIIAGRWKGRLIATPEGQATRPLTDRLKQSLFDWLGQDLSGLRVADVCAGSGSFGIEALSRGAAEVHFIESGRHAAPVIQANLERLGSPAGATVHAAPFALVLPRLADLDLVFCDPPFPWFGERPDDLARMLALAAAAIQPDGAVLIRGESGHELPPVPAATLVESDRRTWGRSWVAWLNRPAAAPSPEA